MASYMAEYAMCVGVDYRFSNVAQIEKELG